jgi:hypothetical protein
VLSFGFVAALIATNISEPIIPTIPRKLAIPVNDIATGIFEDMSGLRMGATISSGPFVGRKFMDYQQRENN